jgi:acyl-CoA dehydrogenase
MPISHRVSDLLRSGEGRIRRRGARYLVWTTGAGQLILEQATLTGLDDDIVDAIFDFQIRDFSTYAVALHGKPTSTSAQQDWALGAIRKPVPDADRFNRVWERVKAYDGAYEMAP